MSKIFICSKLCNSDNEIETETRKELKIESRTSQKRSSLLNRNMSVLNNQKIKGEDWNQVQIRRDSSNSSQLGIKKGVKSGKDKFQYENNKVNKMEKLLSGSFVNDDSENELDDKSERRIVIKGKSIKKRNDNDEKSKYDLSNVNQFNINEIYHCDYEHRNNKYMLITKKIKTTRTGTVKGRKELKNKESYNENDDDNGKMVVNNENIVNVNHSIKKIESISKQSEVYDNDYHYDNTNDNNNAKEERKKKQNENLNISVHWNKIKNEENLIHNNDGKVNIKKKKNEKIEKEKEKVKKNDEGEKKTDFDKKKVNKEKEIETNEKDEEKLKRKKMFQSGNYSEVDIFSMSNAYNKLSKKKIDIDYDKNVIYGKKSNIKSLVDDPIKSSDKSTDVYGSSNVNIQMQNQLPISHHMTKDNNDHKQKHNPHSSVDYQRKEVGDTLKNYVSPSLPTGKEKNIYAQRHLNKKLENIKKEDKLKLEYDYKYSKNNDITNYNKYVNKYQYDQVEENDMSLIKNDYMNKINSQDLIYPDSFYKKSKKSNKIITNIDDDSKKEPIHLFQHRHNRYNQLDRQYDLNKISKNREDNDNYYDYKEPSIYKKKNEPYSCEVCEKIYKDAIIYNKDIDLKQCFGCMNYINPQSLDYYMRKYNKELMKVQKKRLEKLLSSK